MDFAELKRASEMRSIELHINDGSPEQALMYLDERGAAQELVRQQYTGRYPFELLQNADDAARESGIRGRTRFVLTDSALLVADNGAGFDKKQVDAICALGRSSKGPGTSIGHKGLGFKSVGEITDRPQIVSLHTQFQFDAERIYDELIAKFGALPQGQRIPVYAFPYPVKTDDLSPDEETISALRQDGFNTVIRLPFQTEVHRGAVSKTLGENLNPRLLLFLPSIDHLEVRGTDNDFFAEVAREPADGVERVLMETDAGNEEWLVYRGSISPTADALQSLGDEWLHVSEAKFAVAVPLDLEGEQMRPRAGETFPLHVYFPTEESPGLRVAVHAEWVLTMDRRRISHTREAAGLNNQLLEAVADFVASEVAVDLVWRCGRSAEAVRALVPEDSGHLDGAAKSLADLWRTALASVAFLPLADDEALSKPTDVNLLPSTVPNYGQAHRLFDLPLDNTLRADIEADRDVRQFVLKFGSGNQVAEADFVSMLGALSQPLAAEFYSFVMAWRERSWAITEHLKAVPCVLTTNGQFLSPAGHSIFFPRRDESVPDDIPVPIADLTPPIDGLERLLIDLDVKNFEWRELIRDYLIKILENVDAEPDERARAMRGLRAYQASRRDSSEVGPAFLGRVLLRARSADGGSTALRRADRMYFGSEWTRSVDLEEIYGAFAQVEFLAADVPRDAAERQADEDFYRMLGVSDHPRVMQTGNANLLLDGPNNPHRRTNVAIYNEWLQEVDARRCLMAHDASFQRLTMSFHVDRLEEIIAAKDPRRNFLLWNQLARHWGKVYQDAMFAHIRCDHRYHSIDPIRSVESLFAYTLRSRAWVPVQVGDGIEVVRPEQAWFETAPPPSYIRARIPLISPPMHHMRGGPSLVAELALIDTISPSVEDLLGLLRMVAAEADEAGSVSHGIETAARWIQHRIDDALNADSEPHASPEDVRVLAMHNGNVLFANQPLYAEDALVRDTWQRVAPILLADNDSGRLKSFLRLTKLDAEIRKIADPLNIRRDEPLSAVVRRIHEANPYIVALIGAENSRMQSAAVRALRNLEVIVCEQLILRYQYDGREVERTDATCFIAVSEKPADGRRSELAGTAYIELDRSAREPNWFAVGSQLAQHLGVGAHADALTMLLKVDAEDRARMMANRHIPAETVARAQMSLKQKLDDDHLGVSILDDYLSPQPPLETRTPAILSSSDANISVGDSLLQPSSQPPAEIAEGAGPDPVAAKALPPEVDIALVTVADAMPGKVDPARRSASERMSSISFGASSSAPSLQSDLEKRRVGKRGEEIVFAKERERIERMGSNPDLVVWQSKQDELSPIDILSVDDDGEVIYIEVKSTLGPDPGDPFYISDAELVEASIRGSRYYIYRVTDVDTEKPRITRWCNPIGLIKNGQGRLLLSTAQMKLGLDQPTDYDA